MQADVARLAAVRVSINDVDTFAIRSPAGAAGARSSGPRILTARGEENAGQ